LARLAYERERRAEAQAMAAGRAPAPSVTTELLHFLGEVEVVFGVWAVVLVAAMVLMRGWEAARHYVNDEVEYTEAVFVVVIMTIASTRPLMNIAERMVGRLAALGRRTPGAWWITILIVGPLLGSIMTEPAAMTICALLLGRQFYDLNPSARLRYATLGLLFVNISIGGTLTNFAAPPVLMVARAWNWDAAFMLGHFGVRAATAVALSTLAYHQIFRKEFASLARRPPQPDVEVPDEEAASQPASLLPVPMWITAVHLAFLGWTVFASHYPVLLIGGLLFFLGFARATAAYQSRIDLRAPLLVGFFLGGLVIHGGLQAWWIAPLLGRLSRVPLFVGATVLTAFNDNALITYLATLVPNLSEPLRIAVVGGAVAGGGLTVIANAPNPAGQSLLRRFFPGGIEPLNLLAAAIPPTLVAAALFLI
jgi:hypothetical protein